MNISRVYNIPNQSGRHISVGNGRSPLDSDMVIEIICFNEKTNNNEIIKMAKNIAISVWHQDMGFID